MSDATKVLLWVQKALARTGATCTITRTTTSRDPSNPTKVVTVVDTYTAPAIVYPQTKYDPASASWTTRTLFIPDLLGVRDETDTLLNSLTSIVWYSKLGDVVQTADGHKYRLLENEQPQLVGQTVACIHQAVNV